MTTLSRCTVTDAARSALEHRLKELENERAQRDRDIDALLARFDAEPDQAPGFTDKDLYDENGDLIV